MMRKGVSELVRGSLRNVSRSISGKKDTPCKPCSDSPAKSTEIPSKSTNPLIKAAETSSKQSQNPWIVTNSSNSTNSAQKPTPPKPQSDRKSESNCFNHKELVPHGNELEKFKTYEVKSNCTSFELKTKGF